ncbi:uncharacterized protein ColSpa_06086 [Colletotrichum spaethianum]|uniref:DUF7580 domain-containing protein n=1 Tax=Colletotrichum spaethianum TaxID=700344 RepID=A0AA37P0Q1_9PEZI|nr:uncharacterized protein ColSpa_06086 [Colletotrichum spaethianum]GKT45905.1 hypothetical protein ColSpa_06086 [Colletotrichum spaethianum]
MAEIAGLVLGAVPLLISAIEHYEDFVEPTVAFFKWKGQLSKVTRRLLMGHTAYEQNVRLLLKQVVSNEDLVDMINDPQSDDWKSEWLVKDLREKLGNAYQPAFSTIQEIARIMISVAANLNIDGSDKVTQDGLEAIVFANPPVSETPIFRQKFHFRKRVAFTMKRRAVGEKLEQLDECNARLYGFLEKAAKLQDNVQSDSSESRVRIRFVAPLQTIQQNASRIHRVLSRSWCRTHGAHEAGLLLEQRLVRRQRRAWRGSSRAVGSMNCFGLCIWRESVLTWLNTEFNLDDNDGSDPRLVQDPASIQTITEICSRIQAAAHPFVGFNLDSSDELRGPCEVQSPPCDLIANGVSLGDYLPSLKQNISFPELYTLAITLVCSVLQLSEAPWLREPWSREDILFLRPGSADNGPVDVRHPYLTRRYPVIDLKTTEPKLEDQPDRLNLLALAVMLLEINVGKPIESLRMQQDMGRDGSFNMGADLSTAQRSLETQVSQGKLTSAFTKAITYCLQCYLDPTASLRNYEFAKTVEERVLEPLEREMQCLLC